MSSSPVSLAPLLPLNNGTQIPAIGLGTWKADKGVIKSTVLQAVQAGYRHIDCASFYGNEKEIGEAFGELFKQQNGNHEETNVKRSDLYVTSKLWNSHHGHVREACLRTLKDLQLDYLDLYLIHWPIAFEFNGFDLSDMNQWMMIVDVDDDRNNDKQKQKRRIRAKLAPITIEQTWREMEKLVEDGLVKSIGVSNFSVQSLLNLCAHAKIRPAVNQIEVQPYLSNDDVIAMARDLADIRTVAYSPFGSGRDGSPLHDSVLAQLGEKYGGKSVAQIILRWNYQRGVVAIPKSVTPERLVQNLNIFDFELSEEDMGAIAALNKNHRFINPALWGVPMFA